MDINTDPLSCFRATDQDLAMGHRPGPDLSLDLGGQLAVHVSLFLTTLTSPDPPLSPVHKPSQTPPSLPPRQPVLSHHSGA